MPMKKRLDNIQGHLLRLEQESAAAPDDLQARMKETLDRIRAEVAELHQQADKLKHATGAAWQSLQDDLDEGIKDVGESVYGMKPDSND